MSDRDLNEPRDEGTDDDAGDRLRRLIPWMGGGGILLLFAVLGYFVLSSLFSAPPPAPNRVQQISLVQPPPPPPPPEMEPPPPAEIEEVETPEIEEMMEELAEEIADEPPPGAELGLDAEGGAGSDAFGLIGKKGGRSLLGGDGSPFGWYGRIVQEDLQNQLQQLEEVRALSYTVVVKIWLSPAGDVETAMIERGSGDPEVDGRLERAIARNVRISSAPPQDMPQPIRLRVTSRI